MSTSQPARLAFAPSELSSWSTVAANLETAGCAVVPVWLSGENYRTRERVSGLLPNTQFISLRQLYAQPWAMIRDVAQIKPLDSELAAEIGPYWDVLWALVQRSEHRLRHPTEIRSRIYLIYAYFRDMLETKQIDFLFISESPHNVCGYLLYLAAKALSIGTFMLANVGLGERLYVTDEIAGRPLQASFKNETISPEDAIQKIQEWPQVAQYIDRIRNSSEFAPHFMAFQKRRNEATVAQYLQTKPRPRTKREFKRYIRGILTIIKFRYLKTDPRAVLAKNYENLAQSAPPTGKYILFPLHFQPEKTTNPEGGLYHEQSLVIRLLRHELPDGWTLCIKEHPTQHTVGLIGHLGRTTEFYAQFQSDPRILFISTKTSMHRLIEKATIVATINGTVGFESALKGTPVLAFGKPWYSGMPGVKNVKTRDEVNKAVQEVVSEHISVMFTDQAIFIAQMLLQSFPGYINPSNALMSTMTEEEVATNITNALLESIPTWASQT